MPTTVFRENTKRNQPVFHTGLALVGIASFAILAFVYWTSREVSWEPLIMAVLGMLLGWLAISSNGHRAPRTLTLDDTGLTYANRSTGRRWTWDELSEAEIHSRNPQTDPYVRIRVDSIDRKARWTLMESLSRSEIRVHMIYDAPLRDICDKLNDYRDRALAGGQ